MPGKQESLLVGWKEIARFLGISERTAKRWKDGLRASGAIFFMRMGRPARRRVGASPGVLVYIVSGSTDALYNASALIGWGAIARYFGVSERKAKNWRLELQESGVTFHYRMGKPGRRSICAFPSELAIWAGTKSRWNETL